MKAFHNDPALRFDVQRHLAYCREKNLFVQGAAWTDDDPRNGCAVILTLGYRTEMYRAYRDYESTLGLPRLLAQVEELIFESLPPDLADELPGRVVDAIGAGADLATFPWKLMLATMLAHEGANHHLIVDMVRECASYLECLAGGGTADAVEANELGCKAYAWVCHVANTVNLHPHPAWEAAILAWHASLAAGTHRFTDPDKELMFAFRKSIERPRSAIAMADRLIASLEACTRESLGEKRDCRPSVARLGQG